MTPAISRSRSPLAQTQTRNAIGSGRAFSTWRSDNLWCFGDKVSDMAESCAAGQAFGIHVLTGHGRAHEADSRALASAGFPVYVVERAFDAIHLLGQATAHQEGRYASRC